MVAKFLDHKFTTIGSLSNDDGDSNENSQKVISLDKKQQLYTCITLFCTFLNRRYTNTTWNFRNFTRPLCKVGEHNAFFIFLNLNTVLLDSTPENLANIWQNWLKLNKIDEVLNGANSLFKWRLSVCCHPEILLPWQRDVTTSPLYYFSDLG